MNLKQISLYLLNLPLINPFETSFGQIKVKRTILSRVETTDGLVGFGEAPALESPCYNHETIETCLHVMKDFLAPLLLQTADGMTVEKANSLFQKIKGNRIARAGLEMALWDIEAKREGISLACKLGGTRKRISVGESIGIKQDLKELLYEVDTYLQAGYQRIKLKIKPGWDHQVIAGVRQTFGDIPLMADANSSYTLADLPLLKSLDKFEMIMLEQPLADDDLWDHARLQKEIITPLCLDESIKNADDARKAVEMGSCRIINIKPCRVGGLLESKKIHDFCFSNDIPVWCGGMLETGVGRAGCIALSSLPNFLYPADISPNHFFYSRDLLEETYQICERGEIEVSQKPGIGYDIDLSFLEKCIVTRIELKS